VRNGVRGRNVLNGVDVDLRSNRNSVGLCDWSGDLNVIQNLLNVDLGRVLNGDLLSDLRVSANWSENLLLGDDRLIERSNVSAESGLQNLRGVTSDDWSVLVVHLRSDDLGSRVVHNGLDGSRGDSSVLHNWGFDFNGFGKSIAHNGSLDDRGWGGDGQRRSSIVHNGGRSLDDGSWCRSRNGCREVVGDGGSSDSNSLDGFRKGIAHNGSLDDWGRCWGRDGCGEVVGDGGSSDSDSLDGFRKGIAHNWSLDDRGRCWGRNRSGEIVGDCGSSDSNGLDFWDGVAHNGSLDDGSWCRGGNWCGEVVGDGGSSDSNSLDGFRKGIAHHSWGRSDNRSRNRCREIISDRGRCCVGHMDAMSRARHSSILKRSGIHRGEKCYKNQRIHLVIT